MCVSGGHLQLPNFRGQAWASMGKSSRCMGHSARTVSLEVFTQMIDGRLEKKKTTHAHTHSEKNKQTTRAG